MKDFYYILGVEGNATQHEVREAYRKLSKKFHPDVNGNDYYFEDRFKEILEAYDTLNDPAKRHRYDAALKKYQADPAAINKKPAYRKATRSIDITFSLVLIALVAVFGTYVYKALYSDKKEKPKQVAQVTTSMPIKPHHKKKHLAKNIKTKPVSEVSKAAIAETKPALKPAVPTVATPKLQPIAQPVKKVIDTPARKVANAAPMITVVPKHENKIPITNVSNPQGQDVFIKSNLTGVVYLRSQSNYSSDVVAIIPTNSRVSVLENGNAFCKIAFNNKTGYVPKWTVQR